MNRFGIREVCDLTFTKKAGSGEGPSSFVIDTAKMSTIESTSSTVYAQGGKGNSRLIAWEGEKTLTFTVEDALLTMESFHALTGAEITSGASQTIFKIKTTTFAAYYEVNATTLIRDDEGVDHNATITIPEAKLQTILNLSMAPTGDPSTFTFTFDAFPNENKELCIIVMEGEAYTPADSSNLTTVTIIKNGVIETKTTENGTPALAITEAGAITLNGTSFTASLQNGEELTNLTVTYAKGTAATIKIVKGTTSTWYII